MDTNILLGITTDPIVSSLTVMRILIGIIGLGVAAKYDLFNNREIPDDIWNIMIISGTLLFSVQLLLSTVPLQLFVQFITNVLVAILIGWTAYLSGFFGGADAKGITAIGVLLPVFPVTVIPLTSIIIPYFSIPTAFPPWDLIWPLPVFVFITNTALVGILLPIIYIGKNMATQRNTQYPILSLVSTKISTNELPVSPGTVVDKKVYPKYDLSTSGLKQYYDLSRHGFSYTFFELYLEWYQKYYDSNATIDSVEWHIEEFIEDTGGEVPSFDSNPLADSIEDVEESLQIIQNSTDEIYVTPSFPYLIPMFIGLVGMIFFGDLLYILLILM